MKGLVVLTTLLCACDGGGTDADPCVFEDTVSFSGNVVPLFERSCSILGCHDGSGPTDPRSEEIRSSLLLTAGSAHAAIVGVDSMTAPDLDLIAPGDPDGSFLIRKVERDFDDVDCSGSDPPGACGDRMPRTLDALSAECIAMLRQWVTDGAVE